MPSFFADSQLQQYSQGKQTSKSKNNRWPKGYRHVEGTIGEVIADLVWPARGEGLAILGLPSARFIQRLRYSQDSPLSEKQFRRKGCKQTSKEKNKGGNLRHRHSIKHKSTMTSRSYPVWLTFPKGKSVFVKDFWLTIVKLFWLTFEERKGGGGWFRSGCYSPTFLGAPWALGYSLILSAISRSCLSTR